MSRDHRPNRVKCEVPGCASFARFGSEFCHAHKDTVVEPGSAAPALPYAARVLLAEVEQRQYLREEFAARLEAGDYRGLFGVQISRMIDQAVKEQGIDTELGALRYVLARSMVEIEDPEIQARVVAHVTGGIARLLRTQHIISGALVSSVQSAVLKLLEEIDA